MGVPAEEFGTGVTSPNGEMRRDSEAKYLYDIYLDIVVKHKVWHLQMLLFAMRYRPGMAPGLRGSFTPISIYTGYLQRCYRMICTHNLSLCSYRESKSKKNTALTPPPFLDLPL